MSEIFHKIAIVGVGLIGGSLALALRQQGVASTLVGIENSAKSAQWALDNGMVDEIVEQVPDDATLVALCVPSDLVSAWVIKLAKHQAAVFDVGSVKGPIVSAVASQIDLPENFVPCHPISGSEKSGPEAARSELFADCMVVLTPTENTSAQALEKVLNCWHYLGAQTSQLTPEDHDSALAITSHLPHLLAFAFMQQVEEKHIPLTGGGFRDFTRIAGANPELWWRIFQLNKDEVLTALDTFTADLQGLAQSIRAVDSESGIAQISDAANKRKTSEVE
ncbi:MAG: prephenate dehydrogenase [Candidatus Azotimanducaceae bacterium]|jgi:prephenate dehydrogenase|tara:strand:- start:1092 stop:1925 length:834 start_codon:yes stop_codon:yes gene_type:complete